VRAVGKSASTRGSGAPALLRRATGVLSATPRRFLATLGLPALALSLGITTVSGLLPVLLEASTGPLVAGALVALEGLFALTVPAIVGPLSDRVRGGPVLFVTGGALLAVGALVLMAFAGGLGLLVAGLVLFQISYFAYLTPFFALFGELVGESERGRSQGAQGIWREAGLGLAFVVGPALLGLWRPAPFLLAAAVFALVTPLFVTLVARRLDGRADEPRMGDPQTPWTVLRENPAIGRFLVANALWETALSALRAFVVLFLTVGLGRSESFASLMLGVVVGAALVAAPLAGWAADRFGRVRTITGALTVYAVAMAGPALTQSALLIPLVFAGAIAGVMVMTLPYALLLDLSPQGKDQGATAGLFGMSRGMGLLAGPLLAGLAISVLRPLFPDTQGYAALFVVAGVALLISLPVLRGLARAHAR
jgi:maltose/moltooligosaccharide transporter